jgi:hypothetical protein
MKVLYKNKVGKLVPLHNSIYCSNCIYNPKGASLSRCIRVGLMELCVGSSNYYEFELSSSNVLIYEN